MKRTFCFLLLLGTACSLYAEAYFAFTANAKKAYRQAVSLRFEEAQSTIASLKMAEPKNLVVYHLENYIDFFTIIINEDEKEFKRLEKNKAYRLSQIKKGDKTSPYYLYTQAEILLQWATARIKFEEYVEAFNEVNKAYKLLEKNQRLFPNFIANNKSMGVLHAAVGNIPDSFKWGVKLLSGMDGTIEQGRKELEEVIKYAKYNDFIFEEESLALYAFLMLHLKNDNEEAWGIIQNNRLDPFTNPMACFVLANVALNTGRNDEAIQILENKPTGSQYHTFQYLDYMLGEAKLHRLDEDAADYLLRFVQNFKGKNYIKEAYQKLAWSRIVEGDLVGYQKYIKLTLTQGHKHSEGDKNAEREAKRKDIPHPVILKGRLLFDGGYYRKALEHMVRFSADNFTQKKHQLEYNYRLGRILHKMKNYPDAIAAYQNTIVKGEDEPYYYACNAALQLGLIYENQSKKEQAHYYYKRCLRMKPDQYRNGLHVRAKAGLNRLKG